MAWRSRHHTHEGGGGSSVHPMSRPCVLPAHLWGAEDRPSTRTNYGQNPTPCDDRLGEGCLLNSNHNAPARALSMTRSHGLPVLEQPERFVVFAPNNRASLAWPPSLPYFLSFLLGSGETSSLRTSPATVTSRPGLVDNGHCRRGPEPSQAARRFDRSHVRCLAGTRAKKDQPLALNWGHYRSGVTGCSLRTVHAGHQQQLGFELDAGTDFDAGSTRLAKMPSCATAAQTYRKQP